MVWVGVKAAKRTVRTVLEDLSVTSGYTFPGNITKIRVVVKISALK